MAMVDNERLPPFLAAVMWLQAKKGRNRMAGDCVRQNVHTECLEVTEPDANDEFTGDKEAYMASVLARYRKILMERTRHHFGYPYNLDFDYGALGQLQHFSRNNLGDPFIESNYGVHSRQFEVGVLDWFARLWEIEKNEYWGYITNCGTEGNLHGILVGHNCQGSRDDLDLVIQTLEESGFTHDRFYIHCDGALFRLMMLSLNVHQRSLSKSPLEV
ncbi:hypothetical protein GH714_020737 [Hevea brasiliensis]|uniref:Uncharacterized protein n=1 Tax=Hevea brasiliensis TaxID=3981 RepID=A0A6A6KRS1_HEVBR|nr:hypothetical protein GH714_020737 [Hevea brasiliensis]